MARKRQSVECNLTQLNSPMSAPPSTAFDELPMDDHGALLLKYSPVGIIVHAADLTVTFANALATELLGVSEAQLRCAPTIGAECSFVSEDESTLKTSEYVANRSRKTRKPVRDHVIGIDRPAPLERAWVSANAFPEVSADGELQRIVVTLVDITERKKTGAELLFYQQVMESAGQIAKVGGWRFDTATGVGFWTNEVARIHDLDPELPISRELGLTYYTDESRPIIEAAVDRAIDHGTPYDLELEIISAKGVRKWIRTIGQPVVEEGRVVRVMGSFQDITERKKTEEALRANANRFSQLFHKGAAGQIITSISDGKISDVNDALCRAIGYSADELIGRMTTELNLWADAGDRQCMIDVFESWGRIHNLEIDLKTRSGEIRTMLTSVEPFDIDGEAHLISTLIDISDRKRAEEMQRKLQEQLLQAQKMESIGLMAGGIAHDFNNILTVQQGYCELMRLQLHPDDPLGKNLGEIEASTERASELTRQLLAFSRKQPLIQKVFDLNELVNNLGSMLRRLIGEHVQLKIVPDSIPANVKADPGQVEQVLVNLVINSRDSMPTGGRLTVEVLRCELDRSDVGYYMDVVAGRYVMIVVSDTGCGMDNEIKRRIFEPFFTTKGLGKGTGLGLSTVYGIVQQNGGNIWVYSEPDQGTTFRVLLPAAKGESSEIVQPVITPAYGSGEMVLVVEDEPSLRQLATALIESLGYRVTATSNGSEALRLIEEQELVPDLLITDIVMPGMSGHTLAQKVRSLLPRLNVIFMSGHTTDAITHHGLLELGAAFLQKPFSRASLATEIQIALRG